MHGDQYILNLGPAFPLVVDVEVAHAPQLLENPSRLRHSLLQLEIFLHCLDLLVENLRIVPILNDLPLWQVHVHNLFISGLGIVLLSDSLVQQVIKVCFLVLLLLIWRLRLFLVIVMALESRVIVFLLQLYIFIPVVLLLGSVVVLILFVGLILVLFEPAQVFLGPIHYLQIVCNNTVTIAAPPVLLLLLFILFGLLVLLLLFLGLRFTVEVVI